MRNRSFDVRRGAAWAGALCASALFAAEPTPVFECADPAAADPAALLAKAEAASPRDVAASFWIKFDDAASVARLGFCDCWLAKDGTLRFRLAAPETELVADHLLITSRFAVKPGEWHHVELSFTINSRRYALYVDGRFVAENDTLLLPQFRFTKPDLAGFRGEVKDYKYFDAALDSEELALADADAEAFAALKARVAASAEKAQNQHLKAWAEEVLKRADAAQASGGKTTIAAWKRLNADADKIATFAAAFLANPKGTVSDQVVTAYEVPATTQDLYLPYSLPKSGSLTNRLETFLAQDEYETASVLVVPFRPVKNFTIRMGDLRGPGGAVMKGSDVDLKLVKRWYRTGGAWASYHVDLRMRVLTPDLVINDDKLVRVDEWKRSNELYMRYPGGARYENVSDFKYDREWMGGTAAWFQDAPTLQPLELKEAGRNQQYLVTFHAAKDAKPGFYAGALEFIADGRVSGRMDVTVRVLPFVLPQPKTYYDVTRNYLSHVNHHDGSDASMLNGIKFNMMNLNSVANNRRGVAQCLRLGYPLTDVFADCRASMPKLDLADPRATDAVLKRQDLMFARQQQRHEKMIEDMTGNADFEIWSCASSEAAWYGAISLGPEHAANALHEHTRTKYFSHGMTRDVPAFSPGVYDMDSSTKKAREYSDIWHATGGRSITYAAPFPGPENPGLMRRVMGLELYKAVQFDGHMMHGYIGDNLNEFTKYPGGDGDYRTFDMAFRQRGGVINRVAIYGYREGFDDVRYATMMKTQALKFRDVKDQILAREAKRQLHWLETVDGNNYDMDAFRAECAYRILVLQDLAAARAGKDK